SMPTPFLGEKVMHPGLQVGPQPGRLHGESLCEGVVAFMPERGFTRAPIVKSSLHRSQGKGSKNDDQNESSVYPPTLCTNRMADCEPMRWRRQPGTARKVILVGDGMANGTPQHQADVWDLVLFDRHSPGYDTDKREEFQAGLRRRFEKNVPSNVWASEL